MSLESSFYSGESWGCVQGLALNSNPCSFGSRNCMDWILTTLVPCLHLIKVDFSDNVKEKSRDLSLEVRLISTSLSEQE